MSVSFTEQHLIAAGNLLVQKSALPLILKFKRNHSAIILNFIHFFMHFHSMPFYKIMVPTVDTVRYDFLVYSLLQAKRPVLLTGPVGTGKTSLAQKVLQRLDPKTYSLLVINMSAQVQCTMKLRVKLQD